MTAPAATVRMIANPVKVTVTMPIDWMFRGFDLAFARLREAASAPQDGNARDLCIALFEMSNWLDSLNDRFPSLAGFVHVKALLFARNRTHHHFAAGLYFNPPTARWTWYRLEILPDDPKGRNKPGERAYSDVAGDQPLDSFLDQIERAVATVR